MVLGRGFTESKTWEIVKEICEDTI